MFLDDGITVVVNYDEKLSEKVRRLQERGLQYDFSGYGPEVVNNHGLFDERHGTISYQVVAPKLEWEGEEKPTEEDVKGFLAQRGLGIGDSRQLLDLIDQNFDQLSDGSFLGKIVALGDSWHFPGQGLDLYQGRVVLTLTCTSGELKLHQFFLRDVLHWLSSRTMFLGFRQT